MLTTSASLVATDETPVVAAVLLVAYPLWDVVATVLDRRRAGAGDRVNTLNIAVGLAATAAMTVAVLDTIGSTLLVFGLWALVSGAIQLSVAIRRRRTVGSQWPMMISGGQSVLAGAVIAGMSGSATSDLTTVAGYAAFGAVWFLVSAVALTIRGERATR
ncbi:DUF308 domain-containing protein [Nocardioides sp. 503]|uniref:DUF308 domain-containing protein n=1 Tax=Nocardioides sp. 503 TaxID=2508326 RepID=UPI001ADBA600|nr:DUF308 domain-containing protein [Nocardioides sp. 503]